MQRSTRVQRNDAQHHPSRDGLSREIVARRSTLIQRSDTQRPSSADELLRETGVRRSTPIHRSDTQHPSSAGVLLREKGKRRSTQIQRSGSQHYSSADELLTEKGVRRSTPIQSHGAQQYRNTDELLMEKRLRRLTPIQWSDAQHHTSSDELLRDKDIENYARCLGVNIANECQLLPHVKAMILGLPANWRVVRNERGAIHYINFRSGKIMPVHPSKGQHYVALQKLRLNDTSSPLKKQHPSIEIQSPSLPSGTAVFRPQNTTKVDIGGKISAARQRTCPSVLTGSVDTPVTRGTSVTVQMHDAKRKTRGEILGKEARGDDNQTQLPRCEAAMEGAQGDHLVAQDNDGKIDIGSAVSADGTPIYPLMRVGSAQMLLMQRKNDGGSMHVANRINTGGEIRDNDAKNSDNQRELQREDASDDCQGDLQAVKDQHDACSGYGHQDAENGRIMNDGYAADDCSENDPRVDGKDCENGPEESGLDAYNDQPEVGTERQDYRLERKRHSENDDQVNDFMDSQMTSSKKGRENSQEESGLDAYDNQQENGIECQDHKLESRRHSEDDDQMNDFQGNQTTSRKTDRESSQEEISLDAYDQPEDGMECHNHQLESRGHSENDDRGSDSQDSQTRISDELEDNRQCTERDYHNNGSNGRDEQQQLTERDTDEDYAEQSDDDSEGSNQQATGEKYDCSRQRNEKKCDHDHLDSNKTDYKMNERKSTDGEQSNNEDAEDHRESYHEEEQNQVFYDDNDTNPCGNVSIHLEDEEPNRTQSGDYDLKGSNDDERQQITVDDVDGNIEESEFECRDGHLLRGDESDSKQTFIGKVNDEKNAELDGVGCESDGFNGEDFIFNIRTDERGDAKKSRDDRWGDSRDKQQVKEEDGGGFQNWNDANMGGDFLKAGRTDFESEQHTNAGESQSDRNANRAGCGKHCQIHETCFYDDEQTKKMVRKVNKQTRGIETDIHSPAKRKETKSDLGQMERPELAADDCQGNVQVAKDQHDASSEYGRNGAENNRVLNEGYAADDFSENDPQVDGTDRENSQEEGGLDAHNDQPEDGNECHKLESRRHSANDDQLNDFQGNQTTSSKTDRENSQEESDLDAYGDQTESCMEFQDQQLEHRGHSEDKDQSNGYQDSGTTSSKEQDDSQQCTEKDFDSCESDGRDGDEQQQVTEGDIDEDYDEQSDVDSANGGQQTSGEEYECDHERHEKRCHAESSETDSEVNERKCTDDERSNDKKVKFHRGSYQEEEGNQVIYDYDEMNMCGDVPSRLEDEGESNRTQSGDYDLKGTDADRRQQIKGDEDDGDCKERKLDFSNWLMPSSDEIQRDDSLNGKGNEDGLEPNGAICRSDGSNGRDSVVEERSDKRGDAELKRENERNHRDDQLSASRDKQQAGRVGGGGYRNRNVTESDGHFPKSIGINFEGGQRVNAEDAVNNRNTNGAGCEKNQQLHKKDLNYGEQTYEPDPEANVQASQTETDAEQQTKGAHAIKYQGQMNGTDRKDNQGNKRNTAEDQRQSLGRSVEDPDMLLEANDKPENPSDGKTRRGTGEEIGKETNRLMNAEVPSQKSDLQSECGAEREHLLVFADRADKDEPEAQPEVCCSCQTAQPDSKLHSCHADVSSPARRTRAEVDVGTSMISSDGASFDERLRRIESTLLNLREVLQRPVTSPLRAEQLLPAQDVRQRAQIQQQHVFKTPAHVKYPFLDSSGLALLTSSTPPATRYERLRQQVLRRIYGNEG